MSYDAVPLYMRSAGYGHIVGDTVACRDCGAEVHRYRLIAYAGCAATLICYVCFSKRLERYVTTGEEAGK